MRRIVVVSKREALARNPFIFAKVLTASFLISNSIRKDVVLYLKLDDKVIRFDGSRLRHLRADELSAWGIIKKALSSKSRSPHPGVSVLDESKADIPNNLICVQKNAPIIKPSRGMGIAIAYPEGEYLFRCVRGKLLTDMTLPHHIIVLYHYILDQEGPEVRRSS